MMSDASLQGADCSFHTQDVTFGVFGLGNKQYEHFCLVGKKVHKAMLALGAEAMVRRGDGDDDDCIDDDFSAWCEDLYKALSQSALVGAKADANGAVEIPVPAYKVDIIQSKGAGVVPFPSGSGISAHSPFLATVTKVQELHTPESDRSCVHVELDISGSQASYEAGDHVGIYAQNSAAVVDQVLQLLGHSGSTLVKFSMPEGDSSQLHEPPPGPITLATAVACFADVLSSPHKETLLALATFAADRDEKARLQLLASPEGKQQYADYISKPHRSLLEILQEFPSAKPSLGAFFGCIAPRLQPRLYSISSSAKLHRSSVHVTCALVRDTMPTGRVHEGICSTVLAKAPAGSKLPVFLRHSAFKLPASASTPVVMVGPGTGLAPFRGFLQERAALSKAGHQLGDAHLFFGCRSRRQDYIYEQELLGYVAEGVLQHLHVAFSREQASKDYVQHHIERQGDALWAALQQQGGHLYVCGDAKHMARDVHRALISLAQAKLGCSGTQAEGWVKALTDSGRYQRDVW
jgi:NADPH-ferrihemoprotein reductase